MITWFLLKRILGLKSNWAFFNLCQICSLANLQCQIEMTGNLAVTHVTSGTNPLYRGLLLMYFFPSCSEITTCHEGWMREVVISTVQDHENNRTDSCHCWWLGQGILKTSHLWETTKLDLSLQKALLGPFAVILIWFVNYITLILSQVIYTAEWERWIKVTAEIKENRE